MVGVACTSQLYEDNTDSGWEVSTTTTKGEKWKKLNTKRKIISILIG